MPKYTYKCNNCEEEFDIDIPISEVPLKKCIKCGETNCLERVWNKGISYINKSGGFYSNSNI